MNKAYYFDEEELEVMAKALAVSIEHNGDVDGTKEALMNDLRLCIAGVL